MSVDKSYGVRGSFRADPAAVAVARHYTEEQLREWGADRFLDAASLIVSELAGNAVRHAHSEFEVALSWTDDAIRIAVSDVSRDRPIPRDPKPGSTSGFGLKVVSDLASEWGVEVGDHGKEIWVQIVGAESDPG